MVYLVELDYELVDFLLWGEPIWGDLIAPDPQMIRSKALNHKDKEHKAEQELLQVEPPGYQEAG